MARVSNRIGSIAESATMAVDAKAKSMRADGIDVIGFGAGEPDFPTPPHIVEAAVEACRNPIFHKYSPAGGLPQLRQKVAEINAREAGVEISPQQVVITNGGKQAIYNTCAALLDPGDEVLLASPYWVTYPEAIGLAGGVTVTVPTDDSTGYRVTIEQLDEALTDRTKALMFVSPSNPTGAVYPPDEIKAIGQWALDRGLWVITDEIYEHLVYGSAKFSSMLDLVPELADRCVIVNGVAKTYAMTGWRVGWLIGPTDVAKAATNLQSHTTSNVGNVSQIAALAALSGPFDEVEAMRRAFDVRRMTMLTMLSEMPGVAVIEPEGAFYVYPSFRELLGSKIGNSMPQTTLELASAVLSEAHVAFVPGEAFGTPGYGRFSYALGDEPLKEGMERLGNFLATSR